MLSQFGFVGMKWMKYKKIGDLTNVITGGTPSTTKPEYWDNGDIPWLQSGCCQNCDVDFAEKYITQEGYDNSSTKLMPKDSVMIALTGATAGKIGYLNFEACGNQSITGILPCELMNQRYLFYFLLSQREKILADCIGGAQPHISQGYVKNIHVPVIPLEKQKEIVDTLSCLFGIINKRQSEIRLLDNFIKARFVEMFGSIYNNKFGYDVMTLQDVCEFIKDGTHQTPTYTHDPINGYKFLSSKDVTSGKVDWKHLKYIPEELHNELYKRISPRKGDILLAKNGTTGVAAIVDRDEVFDIYVSLALLRPLEIVTSEYLCSAINSLETKQQFDCSLKGIGVPNLHLGEIKKTKIIVPHIELQNQFADFVHQVDKSKFMKSF